MNDSKSLIKSSFIPPPKRTQFLRWKIYIQSTITEILNILSCEIQNKAFYFVLFCGTDCHLVEMPVPILYLKDVIQQIDEIDRLYISE